MAVNSLEQSDVTALDKLKTEESLPVVFQCSTCNNIFGDSCAWVSSDRELEVICVNCKLKLSCMAWGAYKIIGNPREADHCRKAVYEFNT